MRGAFVGFLSSKIAIFGQEFELLSVGFYALLAISALVLFLLFAGLLTGLTRNKKQGRTFYQSVGVFLLNGLFIFVSLVSVGLLAFYSHIYYQRSVPVIGMLGIDLGERKSDVLFHKGEPKYVTDDSHIFVCGYGGVLNSEEYIRVTYKNSFVEEISFAPEHELFCGQLEVKGITIGSYQSDLEFRFGNPEKVTEIDQGLTRIYHYPDVNVKFALQKGAVSGITLTNGSRYRSIESLNPRLRLSR